MYELEFYVSTNKRWVADLAQNMRKLSGEEFYFDNRVLHYPPSVGQGRVEFYELKEGLSMLLMDIELHKQLFMLKREIVPSNDYYSLIISLDPKPVKVKGHAGHIAVIGGDLNNAIHFGSTGNPFYLMDDGAGLKRRIALVFTKDWIYKYFNRYSIPISGHQLNDLINDRAIEFTAGMDLQSLHIAEDMFKPDLPAYTSLLYYTGNALCLLSLFLNNLIEKNTSEENYKFDDVSRITDLIDKMLLNIDEVPLLEQAANRTMMSKTKFIKLFKTIYKKNYGDFILEKRLTQASALLKTGMPVADVGYKIGYSNMGHFAAAFKKYYKISPKQFQMQQSHTEE